MGPNPNNSWFIFVFILLNSFWQVGMEGKGFEPTIEALFGKNGFFPDTVSKALYWAEEEMSPKIKEVLEKWVAPLKIEGQKVYHSHNCFC